MAILLTQVGVDSPVPTTLFRDFWEFAARAGSLRDGRAGEGMRGPAAGRRSR